MSTNVNNNSGLSVFTTSLTSVYYKGKETGGIIELEFWDKAKIYAAFIIGFLFAGIGSPIAGLATSYYLRSRKIEQLKLSEREFERLQEKAQNSEQLPKTDNPTANLSNRFNDLFQNTPVKKEFEPLQEKAQNSEQLPKTDNPTANLSNRFNDLFQNPPENSKSAG